MGIRIDKDKTKLMHWTNCRTDKVFPSATLEHPTPGEAPIVKAASVTIRWVGVPLDRKLTFTLMSNPWSKKQKT